MTERRADDATRDVTAWLKCYYMQSMLGEEFDGVISSVVSFGIFVALNDVFVEGLVHVTELGQDYFHFDAARHQMMGERTGKRFRLGDRVRVAVAKVDLDTSQIDFTLADAGHAAGAGTDRPARTSAKAPPRAASAKPAQDKEHAKKPARSGSKKR